MRTFLLFDLYGPLAAWGDVAVGEYRPSAAHPSKSAVMGLIAAALGVDRSNEQILLGLNADYCFGVQVHSQGELLRDYHTIQVPPQRKGVSHLTRRSELRNENLYTILSSRDYRMESVYTVAVWSAGMPSAKIEEIEYALNKPVFQLFLGRKSCPLSIPLDPRTIEANTLKGAFDQYPHKALRWLDEIVKADSVLYYWEALSAADAGMTPSMTTTRRDSLRSRERWQYAERDEHFFQENVGV